MHGHGRGLTLAELVVTVLALALLAALAALALHCRPRREHTHWSPCRMNLNQLSKGMAAYLNEYGGDRWYPFPFDRTRIPHDYNGAEWLASLYWSGVLPDPGVFVCPSSGDSNAGGRDLGTRLGASPTFGSRTVSYAAMQYYSLTDDDGLPTPGAIADDFPPNMPMVCDDTQGPIHHGRADNGGMWVLFFDSHAEFRTNTELELETCVGDRSGGPHNYAIQSMLWQLRN